MAPLFPKDLDAWVLVRTSGGERFLGRCAGALNVGQPVTLSPAYEYLQQLQIQGGKINAPQRLLLPLECQAGHMTIDVVPTVMTFLREATDPERRAWLAMIENAEQLRRQMTLAQQGFVAASADAVRNINGARRP
jgi:hypothetical protein